MIGFDRPLKPRWIYETLQMVEPCSNPSKYNKPFEDIVSELVGSEGKRKVRTVIYRSFIYSFQDNKANIENNLLMKWTKDNSLDFMTPLYLSKILMDYEITRFTTKNIDRAFDNHNNISSRLLSKKVVRKYGDRDVVKRALRAFLRTLVNFNILTKINRSTFNLVNKKALNDKQVLLLLILYAKYYLQSNQINLSEFDNVITHYFQEIDFHKIAKKYHQDYWDYIRERNRNILMVKDVDDIY